MAAGIVGTAFLTNWAFQLELPLLALAIAPLLVVLSNFWLAKQTADSILIVWAFILDTACLTATLMLSGGPSNPFSLLYLVHITLAATILPRKQTWLLGLLAIASFGALFRWRRPIPALESHHVGSGPGLHLLGMWVGFVVACSLITVFSGKISEQLRARERSLLAMQEELAKKDRLASLVTLAAGAAHELSTPLGTIAVVAKELERYASFNPGNTAIAEDSRLIRMEVDRCRTILERMSAEGAEPFGEAPMLVDVAELVESVRLSFADGAVETVCTPSAGDVLVPRHAVVQALSALVKNALDASPAQAPVRLAASAVDGKVQFEVLDHGCGIPADLLHHVGEPFFTTKEPGKGMGLGVFLVRTLAERLGGSLTLNSMAGQGTNALLELPQKISRQSVIS